MAECAYITKNGVNDYHKYKYATAEDVLQKVNESLTKNKIASFVEPELLGFKDVLNLKGNTEHLATVKAVITLIDSDSGESVQFVGIGSGQDAGDKAVMKAQTAATKYAYMLSLCIATGDDPEADSKTDENNFAAPQNAKYLYVLNALETSASGQVGEITILGENGKSHAFKLQGGVDVAPWQNVKKDLKNAAVAAAWLADKGWRRSNGLYSTRLEIPKDFGKIEYIIAIQSRFSYWF